MDALNRAIEDGEVRGPMYGIEPPEITSTQNVWEQILEAEPDAPNDVLNGIVEWADENGYDGLIFSDVIDGEIADSYVAFRPEQIKSSTGNRGTFDGSNPDIRFSLSGAIANQNEGIALSVAAGPLDAGRIRAAIEPIVQRWRNGPAGGVNVVQSVDDLPPGVLRGVKVADAEGEVRALYIPETETVYLVADNLGSLEEAQFALFHEVYGHKGLRAVLGDDYGPTLTRLRMANQGLASQASYWFARYGQQEIKARMLRPGANRMEVEREVRLLAVEEALADRAGEGKPMTGWQVFMAKVQAALRRIGLDRVANWLENRTDAEVMDLLRRARESVERGGHEGVHVLTRHPLASRRESAGRAALQALRSAAAERDFSAAINEIMTGGRSARSFSWWQRTIGTQHHKAKTNRHFAAVYRAAQDYLHDTAAFANDPADLAKDLVPQLNSWRDLMRPLKLKEADREALAAAVFRGTLVDQKVYTDEELREQGLNERQIGMYRQFRAAVDRSLDILVGTDVARYLGDELPAEMKRLLSDGDTHRFKGLVIAHFTNAIERAEGDEKARLRKTLDTIEQKYERIDQLKAQGYAPLMRFGRYSVTVRDAGGAVEFFGLYESQREANAAARAFRESPEFRASTVQTGVLSELEYQQFSGMSPETLELFAEAAGVEKTEIFQEYLKLAKSNRSALKRLIHRKGIAGYSEDVSRVLASFLTSNARAASGNLHIGEMARATEAIPRSMGDVKDEAIKLTQYVQNPTEEAQRVRGLLFMQFLGGSVASAMVNMTQPFMMTYPYLAQFSGMANAARRLTAAMKEAVAGVSDADLRDALAKAEREGIVSPQELHQLQAEASRSMGNNPFVRRTLFVWGSLFALAEQFNRRVSFIAAYRTAREQGMPDPFGFAADAVDVTQGVYNRGNRPNWARGALGATLFTFKQYSITYMEFLKRLPPKERALALAILVAASGVEGLPFADDLDDLVDTLAQHMGSDFNFKLWRTRQLGAILGEGGADFVLRGTSALPGFPLDVSARLSMANLIPGTGVLLKSRQDKAGEVFDVMGPIGGLAQDVLKGEFRPLAIRNLAKGLEMFQTGEYRDTRGRKVREVDPLDAFIKGLGFQPAEVARESRKITMANQQVQLARAVEGEIAARWAQGIVEGDPEMVAEAREMLQRWNERNPDSRIGITRAQIARRAREMRMGRQERFLKATPKEMRGSVL